MSQLGKISLNLDQLVEQNKLSAEQARELWTLRDSETGMSRLVSVLYILGAIAAAAGVVMLKPTATTGLIIALVCLVTGQFLRVKNWQGLEILSLALGIGAAAGLVGWFVLEFGESLSGIVVNSVCTLIVASVALLFRSSFLAALVPLGIGSIIGSGGAYWHASYGIYVRESALTVLLFTPLATLLWFAAQKMKQTAWRSMALVSARMSFVIANFGFWVGSLWGDYVGEHFATAARKSGAGASTLADRTAFRESALYINEFAFVVAWALFSVAAILIGKRFNNRFFEMAGIVFLAINAFTQYFELFRDQPWALIIGGIALVAVALGLVRWQLRKT